MGFQFVNMSAVVSATVGATSSATGFPASRLASTSAPFVRGWRSTSTSSQTLTFTFSGSTSVVGAVLYDANFATATVGGVSRTLSPDPHDSFLTSRYKLWVPFTATASSQTVTIGSQTPTDGAAYFKLGRVHFFTAYTELQQNPRPEMGITGVDPQLIAGDESGSVYESMSRGPGFIREEWSWMGQNSYTTELFTAQKIGRATPFILYHNLGTDSEVYYMQRISEVGIRRGTATYDISMGFRQIP